MATDDVTISVELPARLVSAIDSRMDNVADTALQGGDPDEEPKVRMGNEIREAIAGQVPWVAGQWPPKDQVITTILTPSQWQFVIAEEREAVDICESIGDAVSAQLCRDVLEAVAHLA